MEDRWWNVDEIAAYLGVRRDTAYAWIGTRQAADAARTRPGSDGGAR